MPTPSIPSYSTQADRAENASASSAEVNPELSVVIPCLNEAETIGYCVRKALSTMLEHNIKGEVIVADNGSNDSSPTIARQEGARVVHVAEKGYGNALSSGITHARGRYVIMADADASYDFAEIPKFLTKLRRGHTLVQGCRLRSGGGVVMPKAMPFLHRWVGNPFFSRLVQIMFHAPVHDVNCGMRGFTKELYQKLDQRCTGMEFAVEMVLKAALYGESIAEVPITLHRDGRTNGKPHLRTFRDGWRTLAFFLISSPRWLFFYPGSILIAFGLLGYGIALPGMKLAGVGFDVHTLLLASLSILMGYQAILFAVSAKIFGMMEGLLPVEQRFINLFRYFTLERGICAGVLCFGVGLSLLILVLYEWWSVGFGRLDAQSSLRLFVPGILFTALGVQTILSSFFLGILGLQIKRIDSKK